MKSKRSITLVTDGFPTIKNVESYLKNEFTFLKKEGAEVCLITDVSSSNEHKGLADVYFYKKSFVFFIKALFSPLLWQELILERSRSKTMNLNKVKIAIGFLANALHFKNYLKNKQTSIIYTYWMTPKTLGACLNGETVYSRIHGFDVYFERHPENYLPFRNYLLGKIERIGAISLQGKNYMEEKFPSFKGKIQVRRLGVEIPSRFMPRIVGKTFHIISCSALIPLKQVNLIIEALSQVSVKIKWTHFGNGPLEDDLKKQAKKLPDNIDVNWMGYCENSQVLVFYKDNRPDLFLNTSTTEGIPVSIMESYAHSIPVIAPDIGGVREIFFDKKFLLSSKFDADELADIIRFFLELDENAQYLMRKGVFEHAVNKLSFATLYKDWHKELFKSL